jgi:hypothetical protein
VTSSNVAQATITITATTGNKPSLSGTAQVSGGLMTNQDAPPSVSQGGVLNAASYQLNSAVSPGSLVAMFGQNLASSTG